MRKGEILTLLVATLLVSSYAQPCLDPNGKAVSWWVQLIFPGSVPGGFAYFDSSFAAPSFVVRGEAPDASDTPMTRTLTQINTQKLQSIAWNDEHPSGKSSSSKAHSKGVLAYNELSQIGFFIVHSMPAFPAFNGFTVNTTIDDSQSIYGQHVFCLSLDDGMLGDLMTKIYPIRPFIYATNLNNPDSIQNLLNKGVLEQPNYSELFTYKNYTINGTQMRFIFKNGKINGSIFEDGLTNMLQSPIMAETWGRPLQDPWCGSPYVVENVQIVQLNSQAQWKETQDHSKWAYAEKNNFVCFGDMNRMSSQWKRGGAFYCLNSPLLKSAMVSITSKTETCN